jgi:plastocyanin
MPLLRRDTVNPARTLNALGLALALTGTPTAFAADHVVVQRNKAFAVTRLSVEVGDTVTFLNLDDVPHNAFSLSKSNPFDTGMVMKGGSKAITFARPGAVEVECAVHPGMTLAVDVRP